MSDNIEEVTIEEALARTSFGKYNYLLIIFTGLVLNGVVFESIGICFSLPVLECDLNLTYQQQGILASVSFLGIILSSHLWGFLADTTGRKRIIHPALLAGFLVTIASSFSPNFETLAVTRFLSGILVSAGSATIIAYLSEFHCERYRNHAILCAAFIAAFMAIFFPLIAWLFINQDWQFHVPYLNIEYKPWRSYTVACGIISFMCGLFMFKLPESPKYLVLVGRLDEALLIVKSMHYVNTGERNSFQVNSILPDIDTAKDRTVVANKKSLYSFMQLLWYQTAPLFMRKHIRKTFLASFLQFIIFFSSQGVYMWFPYILNSSMQYTQRHTEPMTICEILEFTKSTNFTMHSGVETCVTTLEISTFTHTIALEVIYLVMLIFIIYAIDKLGRRMMLFAILTLCGSCGILAMLLKLPLIAIYLFVVFLCCGLGKTVIDAIVVDMYPTNLRAMAVCIAVMVGRIGSVVGSNIVGILLENSCEITLYGSAVTILVAGFLGLLLPSQRNVGRKIVSTTTNENC